MVTNKHTHTHTHTHTPHTLSQVGGGVDVFASSELELETYFARQKALELKFKNKSQKT